MYQRERSYLEFKVTFIHILILFISLIFIGGFLFYIGYSAGRNSNIKDGINLRSQEDNFKSGEVLQIDPEEQIPKKKEKTETDIISKELNNYNKKEHTKSATEKILRVKRKTYYAIQVGSFKSHKLAKNYLSRFTSMGYQTDICQITLEGKIWFRVRVGAFKSLSLAKLKKKELEKLEKGKFTVVKSN